MARRTSDSSTRSTRAGSSAASGRSGTRSSSSSSRVANGRATAGTRGTTRGTAGASTKRSAAKGAGRATTSTRTSSTAAATRSAAKRPGMGISRVDQESTRTHGYAVRIGYERTDAGSWRPRHTAFFGDASHGGQAKALKAAESWARETREKDQRAQSRGTRAGR